MLQLQWENLDYMKEMQVIPPFKWFYQENQSWTVEVKSFNSTSPYRYQWYLQGKRWDSCRCPKNIGPVLTMLITIGISKVRCRHSRRRQRGQKKVCTSPVWKLDTTEGLIFTLDKMLMMGGNTKGDSRWFSCTVVKFLLTLHKLLHQNFDNDRTWWG